MVFALLASELTLCACTDTIHTLLCVSVITDSVPVYPGLSNVANAM